MFSRLKEAKRILTYRDPDFGPDAVIEERKVAQPTRSGRVVAHLFEFLFMVLILARIAGIVSERVEKMIPATHSVSLATLAAAIGILLVAIVHAINNDIQQRIRARVNLVELLAPYFGHKLDATIRVLKS